VVRAKYSVLLDEIWESRGCHCIGRALRDSIDQLVQLLCAANAPSARDSGSQSEQLIGITTFGGALKTLKKTSKHIFAANSPCLAQ
jgi:hypothetical protein